MHFKINLHPTIDFRHPIRNTYMLFTGCEVRTEKIFSRGLRSGPRPRDASEAEGKYFLVQTDLNGK